MTLTTSVNAQNRVTAAVMASPPTITTQTAAPVAPFVAVATRTSPTLRISGPTYLNQFGSGMMLPQPHTDGGYSTSVSWTAAWRVEFDFDGQIFYFSTSVNGGELLRVWVNDQPHTATPVAMSTLGGGTNNTMYLKVDLGSRAYRRIMLEIESPTNAMKFNSLYAKATDGFFPPATASSRFMWLGDSYGYGTGATYYKNAFPITLSWLLGFADVWNFGAVPSTGIVQSNTTNPATGYGDYRQRLAKYVLPYAPDVLVIAGSINDVNTWPANQALIKPQLLALINEVKAAYPNCQIITTSPLYVAGPLANLLVRDQIKVASALAGVPFIDMMDSTYNYFTGTGNSGTRTTVADGVTNSTTTVTSATAAFTTADNGRILIGSGIPANATMTYVNATTVTISSAATATASGVTLQVTNQTGLGNADYYRASDGTHPNDAGHAALARILANRLAPILGVSVGAF